MSKFETNTAAVLYRWKVKGEKNPVKFVCPWRSHTVDRVDVLADAKAVMTRKGGGYLVEAAVPLATLGFAPQAGSTGSPQAGKEYKLDMGVIFSDAKGNDRAARVYWANKATGLVNDVPGEIMASPEMWGKATVAP